MIANGPFADVTVTVAVEVADPAVFVAMSVYIVVADGFTLVEPLAAAEVKVPGVIEIVVAPLVVQFNVLLAPGLMLAGLAVKERIVGLLGGAALTVTVAVEVAEPAAFVAVSV